MLVIHPSSCCDICLDLYSTSDLATSPHAIQCGHIFCFRCLYSFDTSTCPFCREVFDLDGAKKLHVGNAPEREDAERDNADQDNAKRDNAKQGVVHDHANFLLHRMSLISGEGVPEADVAEVVSEVQEWLESQPDDPYSHIPLRAALYSLHRYKALQLENEREKAEYRLRDLLRNSTLTTGHGSRTSRAVEDSIARIEEIETEHALASRAMEDNLTRIEEIEIEHALEVIIEFSSVYVGLNLRPHSCHNCNLSCKTLTIPNLKISTSPTHHWQRSG
ncbi:uncharacterized protein BJ212DRAFT_1354533 [Suillus subaureus]|uniref:RING-type domain-containing protein n=1 Tax=Suillus subaureus TaxID=48587 RepID=A0A9P7EAR7_9AGAM|nr:uncharacterized protein BJ212DRAFT_1354533 [Suillus subaureus]KAG1816381.1 hypothetical protein BJ212DRAFT_1354533 [Suillus subaureus]